jgi:hypothetical protein
MIVGPILIHREGRPLRLCVRKDRIHWRRHKYWKASLLAVIVFIIGIAHSITLGSFNKILE